MNEINGIMLRQMRQNAGLYQREIASILGVSQQTVNDYESGQYNIPKHRQQQVIAALNVSNEELELYKKLQKKGVEA